jgi:hypothetical protein
MDSFFIIIMFVNDFATKLSINIQTIIIWHSKYQQLMMVRPSKHSNGFRHSYVAGILTMKNGVSTPFHT